MKATGQLYGDHSEQYSSVYLRAAQILDGNTEVEGELNNFTVIILQYMHLLNHHTVHLKRTYGICQYLKAEGNTSRRSPTSLRVEVGLKIGRR